ncbi:MAG: hypothetical protein J2P46_02875 [Zavarzinella sp.]|nr:hypothetical protein [Zavarzinella sp.]
MSKWVSWRLALVPVASVFLLTAGSGQGQAPPPDVPPLPDIGPAPLARPMVPQATAPVSVEDLMNQLERLRKEKAEIEKRERAVLQQLKERLKQQGERLSKMGIAVTPPSPGPDTKDVGLPLVPPKDAPDNSNRPPAAK